MEDSILIFQDTEKTSFKSDRLRKNLKAALKEAGYNYYFDKLEKNPRIAHFLPPFKASNIDRAKVFDKKIIISAFYTEGEKNSAISNHREVNDLSKLWVEQNYFKSLKKADLIFVPSNEFKDALISKGINKNSINIVSPGVNTKIYQYLPETDMDLARRYYSINESTKILLFFGSTKDKSLMNDLYEYCEKQKDKDIKCILFLTNNENIGSFSFKLKSLLSKKPDNLIITNFSDINVYRSLLKNSRALIYLNSYMIDEIQMLEAMASGLQVIGYSRVFSSEVLEHEIVIAQDNKLDLFESINDFLEYKITNTISNALFYIEEKDVKYLGDYLKDTYQNLLKKGEEEND